MSSRVISILAAFLLSNHPLLMPQEAFSLADPGATDVFFVDAAHGFVSVEGSGVSYLARTTDGGQTWARLPHPAVSKFFFLDANLGWALSASWDSGHQVSVLATTDGGTSWSKLATLPGTVDRQTVQIYADLLFVSSREGWVVGYTGGGLGVALFTADGGRSFQFVPQLSGRFRALHRIISTGKDAVWVVGQDSVFFSSDQGKTWERQLGPDNMPGQRRSISLYGGAATRDGKVWAVGISGLGVILASEDFGKHWRIALEADLKGFEDVTFWDEKEGCAVGASLALYCTADGGRTWAARKVLPKAKIQHPFLDNLFLRLRFTNGGQTGWVLSAEGSLYQSLDRGNTWREVELGRFGQQ